MKWILSSHHLCGTKHCWNTPCAAGCWDFLGLQHDLYGISIHVDEWCLTSTSYLLMTVEEPFIHKLGPRCIKNWDAVLLPVAFSMVRTLHWMSSSLLNSATKKMCSMFSARETVCLLWKVLPQRDWPPKPYLWLMSPPWIKKFGMIQWKIISLYLNLSTPTARRPKCSVASNAISLNNWKTNLSNTKGCMIRGWMTDKSNCKIWSQTARWLWYYHSCRLNTFKKESRSIHGQHVDWQN